MISFSNLLGNSQKFMALARQLNDSRIVNCCVIGASMSEPHTSELNGRIYMVIYIVRTSIACICVQCMDNMCVT